MARTLFFTVEGGVSDQIVRQLASLELSGSKVAQRLREIKKELRTTTETKEIERLNKEFTKLSLEQAEARQQSRELKRELRSQEREFQAAKFAVGSYNELNFTLQALRKEFRALSAEAREGLAGRQLLDQIGRLDRELKKQDKQLGQSTRFVGEYERGIARLKDLLGAFGLEIGLNALIAAGQRVIQINSEISDSIADIQKTTGLAKTNVESLVDSLKTIDTRTTLEGLAEIATAAGRLGIGRNLLEAGDLDGAEKEILEFTRVVDRAFVALGDELEGSAEDIATTLGKISAIFNLEQTLGVSEGINAIGSAVNELGANTKATSDFILDFTGRLQGVANLAGIAAGDILGLGATADELGLRVESSATAIQQFIVSLGEDIPGFAKIAGTSLEEFSELARTDVNEAFLRVLEGARSSSSGLELLNETIAKLGLTGSREIASITALTQSVDDLRKNQELANDQIEIGTSLTDEFNIKNNTLAAQIDKLTNSITNLVVNSNIINFFTDITEGINELIRPAESLTDTFFRQTEEAFNLERRLNPLLEEYEALTREADLNNEQQEALENTIRDIAKLMPAAITEVDKYGNALGISADRARELLEAERARLEFVNKEAIQSTKNQISALEEEADALQELFKVENARFNNLQNIDGRIAKVTGSIRQGFSKVTFLEDDEINALQERLGSTTRFLEGARQELNRLSGDFDDLNKETMETSETIDETAESFSGLDTGVKKTTNTIAGLEAQQKSLREELENTDRTTERFKEVQQDLLKVTRELKREQDAVRVTFKSLKDAFDAPAGSIKFLENEVKKLKDQVAEAPPNELQAELQKLVDAEEDLEKTKQQLDNIKNILSGEFGEVDLTESISLQDLDQAITQSGGLSAALQKRANEDADLLRDIQANALRETEELNEEKRQEAFEFFLDDIRRRELAAIDAARDSIDDTEKFEEERTRISAEAEKERILLRLQLVEDGSTEQLELLQDLADQEVEINRTKLEKIVEQEDEVREALKNLAFDSAQAISDTLFNIAESNLAKEKKQRLDDLDKRLKEELAKVKGNEKAEVEVKKKFEKEREEIEEEALKKEKALAVRKTLINNSIAIIKAFAELGPILGAIAAAGIALNTALQIAEINKAEQGTLVEINKRNQAASQSIQVLTPGAIVRPGQPAIAPAYKSVIQPGFTTIPKATTSAEQGIQVLTPGATVRPGQNAIGPSHGSGGIKTILNGRLVEIEGGERVEMTEGGGIAIIKRKATEKNKPILDSIAGQVFPGKAQILSAINTSAGGVGFAQEGISIPQVVNPNGVSVGLVAKFSEQDIEMLATKIANSTAEAVGPVVESAAFAGTKEGSFQGLDDTLRERERQETLRNQTGIS